MSTEERDWSLVRHSPADANRALQSEISWIRKVSESEFQALNKKSRLVDTYMGDWPWRKIVNSANSFIKVVLDAASSANKSSTIINESDRVTANLAIAHTVDLMDGWLRDCEELSEEKDAADVTNALSAVLEEQTATSLLRRIRAAEVSDMVNMQIVSIAPYQFTVTLSEAAQRAGKIATGPDCVQLIHTVLDELSLIAEAELILRKPDFLDAARMFKTLQLECLYGIPGIILDNQLKDITTGGEGNITLQGFPITNLEILLGNVRKAEQARAARRQRVSGQKSTEGHTTVNTSIMGASEDEVGPSQRQNQGQEDAPSPTATPQPVEVASWELLSHETRHLPEEIEARWSQSLGDTLRQDHDTLFKKTQSFVAAAGARLLAQSDKVESIRQEAGLAFSFPPNAEDISNLVETNNEANRQVALCLANMLALRRLSNSMKSLQAPSKSRVTFDGRHDSWWSSGAFHRVSELVESTLYLISFDEDALAAADPQKNSWVHYTQLAAKDLEFGALEGCVVNSSRAVRLWLNEIEQMQTPANSPLGRRRNSVQDSIVLLQSTAESICRGDAISTPTLWLLSEYWCRTFAEWHHESLRRVETQLKYVADAREDRDVSD
ncbi:hypothetical protein AB0878_33140 [Amycolatopsis sp. NPDC047767]|uniref:hypothetical protein n=1 Tax=Amycolatopsis sp. NPDC047767 TaxID=3156765 RepID=UPI003455498B